MQSQTRKLQRQRWISKLFGLIVCASLMLSSIAAAPYVPPAQEPTPEQEPAAAVEPAAPVLPAGEIPTDSSRVNFHRIVMKFNQGMDVALQGQGLVSASGADLTPVQQTLQGLEVRPVFTTAANLMGKLQASAAAVDPARLPALDQYFYVELKPEATFEQSQALLTQLLGDPMIELAHMEPIYRPASASLIAADLSDEQGYLNPAAVGGLDAEYAWTVTGGRGLGVQVIDIQEGWQIGHEDLPLRTADLIESSNSSDQTWVNHGAAVAGILAGKNNGTGITGIASDTHIRMVSTVNFLTPDAILKAVENSEEGDIILITEQALGPLSEETCPAACDCSAFENIPVEYWQENFDAIYTATELGIIVIEAAGNGAMNLDATRYKGYFNRSNRDSGAILVGAGTPDVTHAPVCDANYSKRVDLQGWGSDVVTAGYGDHPDSGDTANQYYTETFGGSSAAAAMVAGAVSSVQGIAKNRGYLLSGAEIRSILRSTGSAQGAQTDKNIGPMPNLKDAIDKKLTAGVVLISPPDNSTVRTLLPTLDWQDYFDATEYQLQVGTNSTFTNVVLDINRTSSEYTLATRLSASVPLYFWRVRPFVNDVWENWSTNVFHFSVDAVSAPAITAVGAPANSAIITNADNNFRPTFTWKAPTNTPDGYEIVISTNYDLSDGINAYPDTNSYVPVAGLTPNTRYYWRVRSFFGNPPDDASFGPWTGRRVFYTALDASGLNPLVISANDDTLRPTFDWNDVENAKAYQLQASTVATFKTLSHSATITLPSGESIVPSEYAAKTDLPRGKDLFWRVRAKGAYGWSSWAVAAATLQTPIPPNPPSPILPAANAVSNTWETGMLFTWSKPGNNPDTFQLQIASDNKFENIAVDETGIPIPDPTDVIKVPNFTVTGLEPENVYYWRVRAIGDGASNWSTIRRFYTTPPAPTNLSVEQNDSLRPTFNWDKVDIARSYQLQVVKDVPTVPDDEKYKLFTSARLLANNTTTSSPPYIIGTTLPRTNPDTEPDKVFLWRVRAGGVYGYGAWSEISTVTTPNPPNPPELVSPSTGANLSNFAPLLDWYGSVKVSGNTASNAVGYQLQVSNRTNFVIVDVDTDTLIEVGEADLPTTSYQLATDALRFAGTYYWRVRAVNANGEFSLWTSPFSFNTPGMVSGVITDALTDDPLPNVIIQVANRTMQTTTDANGYFAIRGMPSGTFSLTASVSGYMRQTVVVSTGYAANRTRNLAMAPIPADGNIRIALTWSGAPADLNAHLWLPATNKAHISPDNLGGDESLATMERTDSDGYGPEIITLSGTFSGKYVFAVYTPAGVDQLALSKARVVIYDGDDYLTTVTITDTGSGRWWKAFTLDGSTHKVTVQNVITSSNPAPYADPAP